MHQCLFVNIFKKVPTNCRAKELGMVFTILGRFAQYFIGKWPIFCPKIGLGKSLTGLLFDKDHKLLDDIINIYTLL